MFVVVIINAQAWRPPRSALAPTGVTRLYRLFLATALIMVLCVEIKSRSGSVDNRGKKMLFGGERGMPS